LSYVDESPVQLGLQALVALRTSPERFNFGSNLKYTPKFERSGKAIIEVNVTPDERIIYLSPIFKMNKISEAQKVAGNSMVMWGNTYDLDDIDNGVSKAPCNGPGMTYFLVEGARNDLDDIKVVFGTLLVGKLFVGKMHSGTVYKEDEEILGELTVKQFGDERRHLAQLLGIRDNAFRIAINFIES
jgi:uncharacterized protein YkuJ